MQLVLRGCLRAVLFSILVSGAAFAATIQVKSGDPTPDGGGCGSKQNPCDTIQSGVDAAATGDVVNVAKGLYEENVVVATPGIRVRGGGTLLGLALDSCPGDTGRTTLVPCSVPQTAPACAEAWFLDASEGVPVATSCHWDGASCIACNAENAESTLCTNTCGGETPAALRITAGDVTIEKLRVRGSPYVGIAIKEDGVTLRGTRIERTGNACVTVSGNAATLSGTSLGSCGDAGVLARGDDIVLTANRVTSTTREALRIRGARAIVTRNTGLLLGSDGVRIDGDGAVVERNRVTFGGGAGVDLRGDGFHIVRNTIRATLDGVDLACRTVPTECPARTFQARCADQLTQGDCEDRAETTLNNGLMSCFWDGNCDVCNLNQEELGNCTDACLATPGDRCVDGVVEANKVSEVFADFCVAAESFGSGLVLERNATSTCAFGGFDLSGGAIRAEGNSVTGAGTLAQAIGFLVRGEGHVLESNVARACSGDGFRIEDDALNVSLSRNQSIDNGDDGFEIVALAAGISISDSVASNNVSDGFVVRAGADTTTLTRNRASGNLFDVCDLGTGSVLVDNRFGTTGIFCHEDY
jgi:hypothetical protein